MAKARKDVSSGPPFWDRPIANVVVLGPLTLLLIALLMAYVLRPGPASSHALPEPASASAPAAARPAPAA